MTRWIPRLSVALAPTLSACGAKEKEWHPSASSLPVLDEPGLWEVDDMVRERWDDPDVTVPDGTLVAEATATVIYSNFDGVTLTRGADNAVKNSTQICGATWAKSGASEAKKASLQKTLQAMMNDFNVVLTLKRPTMGTYDMIVIGPPPSSCAQAGAGGIAPLDCGNKNRANICFDFTAGTAVIMAQEIGHTYGLIHNDVACDVMGASYSKKKCDSGKLGYIDMEGPRLGGSGCGASSQNSYQAMKKILGAWPGGAHPDPTGDGSSCMDMAEPTVKINEPSDGATVMESFKVAAEASDDCGVNVVHIDVAPDMLAADCKASPCSWDLNMLSPGTKTIKITSTDTSGKTAAAMINVTVPSAGGGGKGGGGGNGGAAGNGQGPGNGKVAGSGCVYGSAEPGGGAACLVSALGLVRALRRKRP